VWRYRGTPYYLAHQAQRLGITQVLADRARHNPEVYRASCLLAQLCERYHNSRKEDGQPILGAVEIAQVKGTLEQVELERHKLHLLAATADAMLDEAWAAFGLEPPRRSFQVTSLYDDARPIPHHNGTAPAVESLIESG
jgi:hypothetical protein